MNRSPSSKGQDAPCSAAGRLPEVALIGAAKSATTLLANWLSQHPSLQLGRIKEPNYFSHDDQFARGQRWYEGLYARVPRTRLAIDASTGYTRWPQCPSAAERMYEAHPTMRLIYLMRHPVDRAYSHYVHRWSKECHPNEPFRIPFEQYVQQDPMCMDSSRYREQLQRYLQYFSPESICCVFTFQLRERPDEVLSRIARFLSLDADSRHFGPRPARGNHSDEFLASRVRMGIVSKVKKHPLLSRAVDLTPRILRELGYGAIRRSSMGRAVATQFTPPPMSDLTRERLLEAFAPSNRWVAQFTGVDLSEWDT